MFSKLKNEAAGLAWTLGGVAMVLITLSGDTLKYGLWISGVSALVYLLGVMFSDPDSE